MILYCRFLFVVVFYCFRMFFCNFECLLATGAHLRRQGHLDCKNNEKDRFSPALLEVILESIWAPGGMIICVL